MKHIIPEAVRKMLRAELKQRFGSALHPRRLRVAVGTHCYSITVAWEPQNGFEMRNRPRCPICVRLRRAVLYVPALRLAPPKYVTIATFRRGMKDADTAGWLGDQIQQAIDRDQRRLQISLFRVRRLVAQIRLYLQETLDLGLSLEGQPECTVEANALILASRLKCAAHPAVPIDVVWNLAGHHLEVETSMVIDPLVPDETTPADEIPTRKVRSRCGQVNLRDLVPSYLNALCEELACHIPRWLVLPFLSRLFAAEDRQTLLAVVPPILARDATRRGGSPERTRRLVGDTLRQLKRFPETADRVLCEWFLHAAAGSCTARADRESAFDACRHAYARYVRLPGPNAQPIPDPLPLLQRTVAASPSQAESGLHAELLESSSWFIRESTLEQIRDWILFLFDAPNFGTSYMRRQLVDTTS